MKTNQEYVKKLEAVAEAALRLLSVHGSERKADAEACSKLYAALREIGK